MKLISRGPALVLLQASGPFSHARLTMCAVLDSCVGEQGLQSSRDCIASMMLLLLGQIAVGAL